MGPTVVVLSVLSGVDADGGEEVLLGGVEGVPVGALLLGPSLDGGGVVLAGVVLLAGLVVGALVMVGDSAQAIYHWRGAKDFMTGFDGTQLALS